MSGSSSNSGGERKDPPPPKPQIDHEAERKVAQQKLKPDPSGVSTDSSTRKRYESSATPAPENESVNEGLKHDLNIVQDTFRLDRIPKESHFLGLAGTVPYLATSISTLYLSWDLKQQLPTGSSLRDSIVINQETAQYLLSVIEPVQLGYGAVIISFLGAIHWGLEYAEKQPLLERTRFRYGMGVAASIVAWPTVLMPIEYGLTSQFMAFVALYFADAKAASRGWAPKWYGQYRFMLTAMVGFAIFVSLIGRSEIEKTEKLSKQHLKSSMNRPGLADPDTNWSKIEAEEMEKARKEKEEKEKKNKQSKKGKADKGKSADKDKDDDDKTKDSKDEKSKFNDKDKDSKSDDKAKEKKEKDEGGDKEKEGKKQESESSEDKEEDGDKDKSSESSDSKEDKKGKQ